MKIRWGLEDQLKMVLLEFDWYFNDIETNQFSYNAQYKAQKVQEFKCAIVILFYIQSISKYLD